MQGKVSDNVLSDMLAFSYPRIQGGPVVAYNNIDAGTQNVRCGTGVAKRQDGGDGGGACSLEPLSSASTSASEPALASTSTSASTSATATLAPQPGEPLFRFGTPDNQCPSLQFDTCSCYCTTYEDCGPCLEGETVCNLGKNGLPGCCQCGG